MHLSLNYSCDHTLVNSIDRLTFQPTLKHFHTSLNKKKSNNFFLIEFRQIQITKCVKKRRNKGVEDNLKLTRKQVGVVDLCVLAS